MINNPPLTDVIVVALARLIDDSQLSEKREPTQYDLDLLFAQVSITAGDQPGPGGRPIGKAKRIRGALNWALTNNPKGGEAFISALISTVQGYGGFRQQSMNYCGAEAIANLGSAIAAQGWELSMDGNLAPNVLEAMKGRQLTDALASSPTLTEQDEAYWTAHCWLVRLKTSWKLRRPMCWSKNGVLTPRTPIFRCCWAKRLPHWA